MMINDDEHHYMIQKPLHSGERPQRQFSPKLKGNYTHCYMKKLYAFCLDVYESFSRLSITI